MMVKTQRSQEWGHSGTRIQPEVKMTTCLNFDLFEFKSTFRNAHSTINICIFMEFKKFQELPPFWNIGLEQLFSRLYCKRMYSKVKLSLRPKLWSVICDEGKIEVTTTISDICHE